MFEAQPQSESPALNRYHRLMPVLLGLAVAWSAIHFFAMLRYDRAITDILPLPETGLSAERAVVVADPDALQWIAHTQQSEAEGRIRLIRWTNTDNHPHGRPVLWPSLHSWWLRFLGHLHTLFSGEPVLVAIAKASNLSNAAYILLFTLPITFLSLRTFGVRGVLIIPILLLVLKDGRYGLRAPDHHLLHVFLTVLYLLSLMRLPLHKQPRDWVFSGCILGLLFWASALSAMIVAIATLFPIPLLLKDRSSQSTKNWFLWSGSAALVIVLSYSLDYELTLSINLECGNPVYAAILLAVTPLIPQWIGFVQSGFCLRTLQLRAILLPGLILGAIGALILINISDWYSPSDEFVSRWISLIHESRRGKLISLLFMDTLMLVFVIALLIAIVRQWAFFPSNTSNFLLGYCLVVVFFFFEQTRVFDFFWPGLALMAVSVLALSRRSWESSFLLLTLLLMQMHAGQDFYSRILDAELFAKRESLPANLQRSYDYALDAARIRNKLEFAPASILASPADSVFLGFYSQIPVYGTYYWENKQGMFRAMHMLFRLRNPETDEFPMIQEFLSSASVDTIYISKDGYMPDFRYTIHGRASLRMKEDQFFMGDLAARKPDEHPEWLTLTLETENSKLFRVAPAILDSFE